MNASSIFSITWGSHLPGRLHLTGNLSGQTFLEDLHRRILRRYRFDDEFIQLAEEVQDKLLSYTGLLEEFGPQPGRPHADTLTGSKHANMKELRFQADNGVWRVAYAFDPKRQAVLLMAGDKSGSSQKRFYRNLIRSADERFDDWLDRHDR